MKSSTEYVCCRSIEFGQVCGCKMSYRCLATKQCERVVFMGTRKVGKTALIRRLIYKQFCADYDETVEDLYRIFARNRWIELLDTSGSFEFPMMLQHAITTGDIFVLVYAWSDTSSFECVRSLLQLIRANKESNVEVIIVANKIDLPDTTQPSVQIEMLSTIDLRCQFHQCSAKDNTNITELFRMINDCLISEPSSPTDSTSKARKLWDRLRSVSLNRKSK